MEGDIKGKFMGAIIELPLPAFASSAALQGLNVPWHRGAAATKLWLQLVRAPVTSLCIHARLLDLFASWPTE